MPQAVSWLQTTDVGWVRSDLVLTVPLTSIARLSVLVLASDYVGNYSVWSITDVAENYSTTALAVIGSPMRVTQHNNTAGAAAWDVRLVAAGADLRVDVYGATAKTIDWHIDVDVSLLITRRASTSALLTSLVSYWKLDEASDGSVPVTRADSVTTNDLTDTNTVPSGTGIISNCASFNPANSEYLSHVSNAALQTGDIDFTWTSWIQLAVKGLNRFFISKGDMGGVLFEYGLWYDNAVDRYKFWVSDNNSNTGTVQADNFGVPPLNTWSFVAGWYDSAAKTVNISINNGAVNSASYTFGVTTNTREFRIGADVSSGGSGSYWSGLIDETGFWKRVLSAGDLTALYNGGLGLTYPFS